MALDINGLYGEAEKNRLQAFEAAQKDSQNRLQNNLQSIHASYRSGVTQAQNAARISALGLEERLAASGLSSGSPSQSPTSGYTESSRVAADNTLRRNLNALALSKMQKEQDARTQSNTEIAKAQSEYWSAMASLSEKKAEANINQFNKDRYYQLSEREQTLNENKQQSQEKSAAFSRAMERWKTYGVVLPADAAILGVPAGTRTDSSAYNYAKLEQDRWKALL